MTTEVATRVAAQEPRQGGGGIDEGARSCGAHRETRPSDPSAPLGGVARGAERVSARAIGCHESAFPRFTELRQQFSWTRRDLVDRMLPFLPSIDREWVRRVEQHGQRPSREFIEAVAGAFAIPQGAAFNLFTDPQ